MTSPSTLAPPRPASAPVAAPTDRRDRSVDTMVGVLIVLVVVSHAIGPLSGRPAEALTQWLFMFHMPAFVFLSGYLTRMASGWSVRRITARLLLPFAVFQALHVLAQSWSAGEYVAPTPLVPAWTTWYLLSLLAWRLAAPWLERVPHLVPISVAVSLGGGAVSMAGPELSVGRTLGFLPFFALGLAWRDGWFERLRMPHMRAAAAALLTGALVFAFLTEARIRLGVFYLDDGYAALGHGLAEGVAVRAGVLATGLVLTLAIVSLTGWSVPALARIGTASLVIYLVHPFLLYPMRDRTYSDAVPETVWLLVIIAGSAVFAWLASSEPVVRATRPLMDHRWWAGRLTR